MGESPKPRGKSLPRRVFDQAESAVAGRLETLVGSDLFAEAIVLQTKVDRRIDNLIGSTCAAVLHALQIPTRRDVLQLHEHLTAVESRLGDRPNRPVKLLERTDGESATDTEQRRRPSRQ